MTDKIGAKVVLDSLHPLAIEEPRITTLIATVPHIILPQMLTHRVFSRNVGSSRAKPFKVLVESASRENRYVPKKFGKNQAGMQSVEYLTGAEHDAAVAAWNAAADAAIEQATKLFKLNIHKQWCNRILEPFVYVDMLITSSEWQNFLELRDHGDAQPEIEDIAKAVRKALAESTPQKLELGQWHVPFVTKEEQETFPIGTLCQISTARNARISYKTFDGNYSTLEKDVGLYEDLVGSRPLHASPTEHIARAVEPKSHKKSNLGWGWDQFRKHVEQITR